MKGVAYAEIMGLKINDLTLVIEIELIKKMFSQVTMSKESGGVIYGYKLKGLEEYRIVGITLPFDNDKTGRYSFDRSDSNHLEYVRKLWDKDKSIMYLGDWHSHPAEKSIASSLDSSTFIKISQKSITSSSYLIFAIVSKAEILITVYDKKRLTKYDALIPRNSLYNYKS